MTEDSLGDSGGGELGLISARPMLAGPPQVPSDPLTLPLSCPFLAVCLREYPTDTPASAEMKPGDLGHRVHGNVLCLFGKPSAQILLLSMAEVCCGNHVRHSDWLRDKHGSCCGAQGGRSSTFYSPSRANLRSPSLCYLGKHEVKRSCHPGFISGCYVHSWPL